MTKIESDVFLMTIKMKESYSCSKLSDFVNGNFREESGKVKIQVYTHRQDDNLVHVFGVYGISMADVALVLEFLDQDYLDVVEIRIESELV